MLRLACNGGAPYFHSFCAAPRPALRPPSSPRSGEEGDRTDAALDASSVEDSDVARESALAWRGADGPECASIASGQRRGRRLSSGISEAARRGGAALSTRFN